MLMITTLFYCYLGRIIKLYGSYDDFIHTGYMYDFVLPYINMPVFHNLK